MAVTSVESVSVIDGHYYIPKRAAAYLIADGEECAFIDNCTRFSAPYLMAELESRGLAPEQVRYIIVTHIHLDHSGGTDEMAQRCPNAQVICHPRAVRHLMDPSKLIQGVIAIYGEDEFKRVYGAINPIEESRILAMEDNATLDLGARTLRFLFTPGHAKHQFAIHDLATNSIFAGDAFGLSYPTLNVDGMTYAGYVTSPPDFDPGPARESIQRILDAGADRLFLTHYGEFTAQREGAEQLFRQLEAYDALANEAAATDLTGEALEEFCRKRVIENVEQEIVRSGFDPKDDTAAFWAKTEVFVSSKGIALLAERRRSTE